MLARLRRRLAALAERSADWAQPLPGLQTLLAAGSDSTLVESLQRVWASLKPRLVEAWLHPRRQRRAHRIAERRLAQQTAGTAGVLRRMNLARGVLGPVLAELDGVRYGSVGEWDETGLPPPPPLALLAGRALGALPVDVVRELAWGAPMRYEERRQLDAFVRHWSVVGAHMLRLCTATKDPQVRSAFAVAGLALAAVVHALDRSRWLAQSMPRDLEAFAGSRAAPAALRRLARRLALEQVGGSDAEVSEVLHNRLAELRPPAAEGRAAPTGRPVNPQAQPERLATFLKKHAPKAFSYEELRLAPELKGIKNLSSALAEARKRHRGRIVDGGDPETTTFCWLA